MSDIKRDDIDLQEIYLLPNQIQTDKRFDVRPFSSQHSTNIEDGEVEQLAASIERVGQLDAILITRERVLVAGHRRRRAATIINERRSARGESLLKLRCAIDHGGGDLRQKAIVSNLHRQQLSPMDLAYLITQIRKEHAWEGRPGAKMVAQYLGVDVCTVTNTELLMTVDKDMQNKIHERVITTDGALLLIRKVPPAERMQVIEEAVEDTAKTRTGKILDQFQDGKLSRTQSERRLEAPNTRADRPAIIRAIRKLHPTAAPKDRIALSKAELVKAMLELDCDCYSEALRSFIRYLATDFAKGQGTKEELRSRFSMLMQHPPGQRKPVSRSEALVS